nr:unnamed protein product [Callosobruchus analis]
MGMALLNLKMCDLVLYSAKSKSFLNIVHFDEDLAKNLLINVTKKYFESMLHVICKQRINMRMLFIVCNTFY